MFMYSPQVYRIKMSSIKRRKDLEIMQETIVCEISLRRKKIFFVAVYRSPNQTNDELV